MNVHAPNDDKDDDRKDTYYELEHVFDHFPR